MREWLAVNAVSEQNSVSGLLVYFFVPFSSWLEIQVHFWSKSLGALTVRNLQKHATSVLRCCEWSCISWYFIVLYLSQFCYIKYLLLLLSGDFSGYHR
jgi:hypothetical protein